MAVCGEGHSKLEILDDSKWRQAGDWIAVCGHVFSVCQDFLLQPFRMPGLKLGLGARASGHLHLNHVTACPRGIHL